MECFGSFLLGIGVGTAAVFWANYMTGISPFTESWRKSASSRVNIARVERMERK